MAIFVQLTTPLLFAAFALAGGLVLVVSLRLTALADVIADRTNMGEALVGATMLGAATSLSGLVVSFTAAAGGDAPLAFSNGVGGIAAQTLFLAIADVIYRRANLEHAAADTGNLFQCALLLTLLSLPLVAHAGPEITLGGVHPVSVVLVGCYVAALRLGAQVREAPMWRAVETDATREDSLEDSDERGRSARKPLLIFIGLMVILGAAGWHRRPVRGSDHPLRAVFLGGGRAFDCRDNLHARAGDDALCRQAWRAAACGGRYHRRQYF